MSEQQRYSAEELYSSRPAPGKMTIAILVVAALVLSAGCARKAAGHQKGRVDQLSGTAEQKQALLTLYAQAQQSGKTKVILYSAFAYMQPVFHEFSKDFPDIEVTVANAAGATLFSRIQAEAVSGNHAGDAVLSGFSDMAELVKEHRLEADISPTEEGLDARYRDPAGYYQIPFENAFAIVYNPHLVQPEQLPTTVDGLLDPRWKGKIAYFRLAGTSPADVALATLAYEGKLSQQQLEGLHAQGGASADASFLPGVGEGRTTFAVWAPAQFATRLQKEGASLALAFPAGLTILFGPGIGVLDSAPHPAAAKLLKAWLFTPNAQRLLAEQAYSYGTMPGSPSPPGYPPLASFHQRRLPLDQANALLAAFHKRVEVLWTE